MLMFQKLLTLFSLYKQALILDLLKCMRQSSHSLKSGSAPPNTISAGEKKVIRLRFCTVSNLIFVCFHLFA
jgi:hypothetical protein